MARPLEELRTLSEKHNAPIFYAGDIFDKWYAGPEVINFALKHLPPGYAIPGQHDLPNHSYEEIKRSAYWTLVETGHLINIEPYDTIAVHPGLQVWGFPWGSPPTPIEPVDDYPSERRIRVALTHKFIWVDGCGHTGVLTAERVTAYRSAIAGYDIAVFGDNHKGFTHLPVKKGDPTVFNCGGFMRRKIDEREYAPGVGLLLANGTVTRHHLDTTKETFIAQTEAEVLVEKLLDMGAFVSELRGLETNDALNFMAAIKRFLQENNVAKRVAEIIIKACERE